MVGCEGISGMGEIFYRGYLRLVRKVVVLC